MATNEEYNHYINSAKWKTKRKQVLIRDNYTCQSCGVKAKYGLHVHHLTYARFKDEPLTDLTTLCEFCHSKKHGNKKERPKRAKKQVVKMRQKTKRKVKSVKPPRTKSRANKRKSELIAQNEQLHQRQSRKRKTFTAATGRTFRKGLCR